MFQCFYLCKLGPPFGCSASLWSTVASCVACLQLPQEKQLKPVWTDKLTGESYILPPRHFEPRSVHLWDLALIVAYPSKTSRSTTVVSCAVCGHGHKHIGETSKGSVGAQSQQAKANQKHALPGYSHMHKLFDQDQSQELLFV